MAIKSGFFDAAYDEQTGEYDRQYLSEDMANFFYAVTGNGVFKNEGGGLEVQANNTMGVVVKSGYATALGRFILNSADYPITLSPGSSSNARIDIIVLRMSKLQTDRNFTIIAKEGTPALAPIPPTLERTDDVYEMQIAAIEIPRNALSVTSDMITDTRFNTSLCGYVSGFGGHVIRDDDFVAVRQRDNLWFKNATVEDDDEEEATVVRFKQPYTPQIGNVVTGVPGSNAEVTLDIDDEESTLTYNFKIPRGAVGTAAGFGTPTASIDANTGTPEVSISASGPDNAKVFSFAFRNLKGATGAQGPQGIQGPQGMQGEPGADGTVEFDELTPEQQASLKGEKGDKGDPGEPGSVSNVVPQIIKFGNSGNSTISIDTAVQVSGTTKYYRSGFYDIGFTRNSIQYKPVLVMYGFGSSNVPNEDDKIQVRIDSTGRIYFISDAQRVVVPGHSYIYLRVLYMPSSNFENREIMY